MGSFDLLCLSGMIISVLADDSFTTSTGVGQSSSHLYIEDGMCPPDPGNMSVNSADSSALMSDMTHAVHADQSEASQFKFTFDEAACFDATSLLLALGGFVALLMKNALHDSSLNQS